MTSLTIFNNYHINIFLILQLFRNTRVSISSGDRCFQKSSNWSEWWNGTIYLLWNHAYTLLNSSIKLPFLTIEEINDIIEDNFLFKSYIDKSIFDYSKIKNEFELWDFEILIECLVINGIYFDQIEDICGVDIFNSVTSSYCYDKFKKYLSDEHFEAIKWIKKNWMLIVKFVREC